MSLRWVERTRRDIPGLCTPFADGLGFCLGRAVTTASQGKVPMSPAGQTGRGATSVSPSTTGGPAQKPPGNGMAGGPSVVPTAVVSAAHIQTSPQAKVLLHMSGQMTVNQARSAVRTGMEGTGLVSTGKGVPDHCQTFENRY